MSAKHTPGPWRFTRHAHDSNYMRITCSNDPGHGDNLRGYCGEANARLIAAAPDLLEFAEEVRRTGDTRLASMAIAVIAKATGEKP